MQVFRWFCMTPSPSWEPLSFYRMDVVDVYYVAGFGVMGWVPASEYDQAHPTRWLMLQARSCNT